MTAFPEVLERYFDDVALRARIKRVSFKSLMARAEQCDCAQTLFAYIKTSKLLRDERDGILNDLQYANKYISFCARLKIVESALKRIKSRFDDDNIPFLVIKGAPLSHALFGSPAARSTADIDIWLRREDLPRARRRLFEMGYIQPEKPRLWATNQELFVHAAFAPAELHWRPALPALPAPGFGEAYRRSAPCDRFAAGAHVPDLCVMWFILLTHAMEHAFALKTRLDIMAFCSNFIQKRYDQTDESVLHAYAGQFGLARMSRSAFDFVRRILRDGGDADGDSIAFRFLYDNARDAWFKDSSVGAKLVSGRDRKGEAVAGLALRSAAMLLCDAPRDGWTGAAKTFFLGPHKIGRVLHGFFAP